MAEFYASVAIVGGGFAGLSTALHLAEKGQKNVVVLEAEKNPGGHASGRNAGMIRQAISDPALAGLAIEGRQSLASPKKKGWKINFRPTGSLLLACQKDFSELEKTERALKAVGLSYKRITPSAASKKVYVLETGRFESALFCPSDAMVEIGPLLQGFLDKLKRLGVRVFYGQKLERVKKQESGFCLEAGHTFYAKKVVNAAGAWAETFAKKAGALPISFMAYRRHLFFSRSFQGAKTSWPFVWDLSNQFYFRPENKGLLLSPCDKKLFKLGEKIKGSPAEKTDPAMKIELVQKLNDFSPHWKNLKISDAVAGLRTMSPDGRFVIGEDPKLAGFYWAAGLGGHGVTTAFPVGRLAAEAVLGENRGGTLEKAFSPGRLV